MKKAIVTVIGDDKVGIISAVTTQLAERNINILDITQTVLQEYFTMIMLVDLSNINVPFLQVKEDLSALGEKMEMSMRIQHEEIFQSMHRI